MIFTTLRGKRMHSSKTQHRYMHAKKLPHTHIESKTKTRHYGGQK